MDCEGGLNRNPLFHSGNIQCDLVHTRLADDRGAVTTKGATA
jgi:hypothetical protein